MRAFANLLDTLSTTPGRNDKLTLIENYFRSTADPHRGWALAALTDGLPLRLPLRRILLDLMSARVDPVLYQLSRDYVGDTAETVALLWPDGEASTPPTLADAVEAMMGASRAELPGTISSLLDRMNARERWAFLKLIGGAPRVGVSARLARLALASALDKDVTEIEELWHGLKPPYMELFQWADGNAARPDVAGAITFRPMMLAVPLAENEIANLPVNEFVAEWKWDGIRVQISSDRDRCRVFSRTGEDMTSAFPDVASAFAGRTVAVDGELLVVRDGVVAPFSDLQKRLNRKSVSTQLMRRYPAFVRLYDLLSRDDQDLRVHPFVERRAELEAWHASTRPFETDISELLQFEKLEDLVRLRAAARGAEIEGLMLKRKDSPYLAGRPKGHWFKWKRDALTLDCVMMYAQRGSGKRSSFYSDYTFGVWRSTEAGRELVSIGKAYSGFTDHELRELDRFVRNHTVEQYGPVRAVSPELVLEVAFDALQASKRHKSGLAMRFPRIHRIRWDKPAKDADTLDAANALL
jgi:DNA ligase-1